jgi:hypothetical protein
MLRRDFQLPGNMMLYKLSEEFAAFIQHQVVKPDA